MMKYIYLFIVLSFVACSGNQKGQNSAGMIDSLNNQAAATAESPAPDIHNLSDRLPELLIPATIKIDSIHPEWVELSKFEIDSWVPEDFFENRECRVFAMNKFSQDVCTGILYTIELAEGDTEDYGETRHKVVLVLYDNNSRWADDLILAIDAVGLAKINSKKEIIYIFSSEMESIQLTQTNYAIEGLKFKETATKELTFDSSEEGSNAHEAYVKKVFK
jgi:hypothetical protein